MGRYESKETNKQSLAISKEDQAHAIANEGKTNDAVNAYNARLEDYISQGNKTYGEGGDFAKTENTIANDTASAGAAGLEGDLALNAARTGENTAGYGTTAAEARRQGSRDLTSELAKSNLQRLAALSHIQEYSTDASKVPISAYSGLVSDFSHGATGALGPAAESAKTPGFWDTFAPAIIGAGGQVAAGFCPCEGSLIRMADGSDKLVEQLKKGDWLWSVGTLSGPNEVLGELVPRIEGCFKITTKGGKIHSGSWSHTVALATGGYVYMPDALDKTVIGEFETDIVVKVEPIGRKMVYPLLIGGSHVYMADGLAILS